MTRDEQQRVAAKCEVWEVVFQIVSDNPQLAAREFIRKLEAAREADGCGPLQMSAR